jgi:hypothetical protein
MHLGTIANLNAAAGVIASLLYPSRQIRQNTDAVRASSHQAILEGNAVFMLALTQDALAERRGGARTNASALTSSDVASNRGSREQRRATRRPYSGALIDNPAYDLGFLSGGTCARCPAIVAASSIRRRSSGLKSAYSIAKPSSTCRTT